MKTEYKDFIGIFNNVYPDGYCQHLINEFEKFSNIGATSNRQKNDDALRHDKDDSYIGINIKNHDLVAFHGQNSVTLFFDGLQACFNEYSEKFSILRTCGELRATSMKIQRTDKGGGYHIWHTEQGGRYPNRALVYSLYLNTLPKESCGETEFLYQQLRLSPEENTMVIWPAAYTHAHRGNVVYGDTPKYIVTGWFYYDEF